VSRARSRSGRSYSSHSRSKERAARPVPTGEPAHASASKTWVSLLSRRTLHRNAPAIVFLLKRRFPRAICSHLTVQLGTRADRNPFGVITFLSKRTDHPFQASYGSESGPARKQARSVRTKQIESAKNWSEGSTEVLNRARLLDLSACFSASSGRESPVNLQLPGATSHFKSGFSDSQWLCCSLFAQTAHSSRQNLLRLRAYYQIVGVSLAAIKRYGRTIPNHEKVARNVARVSGGKILPYPRPQYLAQYYARRYEPQSSRI